MSRHLPKIFVETESLDLAPLQEGDGVDKEDDDDDDADDGNKKKKKKKKLVVLGSAAAFTGFGGEVVPFSTLAAGSLVTKPLTVAGSVETYLAAILAAMEQTLRLRLDASVIR